LAFWRTQGQEEVDLIVGDRTAIEIKSAKKVSDRFLSGLIRIGDEQSWKHRILVSNDPINAGHSSGILLLHWETFFQNLWDGKYF